MFKDKLDSLSIENQKLLALYGNWMQTPSEREKLTTTGLDEYPAIRKSLYVLFAILEKDNADDILELLSKPYSEAHGSHTFHYEGINITPENKATFMANTNALLKMRNDLRTRWDKDADEHLIGLFLHHDLGKNTEFVLENDLLKNEFGGLDTLSASSHELYLQRYLAKPENAQLSNNMKAVEKWNDIFDGLGCNPAKLASQGYVGLLTWVDKTLDYLTGLNQHNSDLSGNQTEAVNYYLLQKVKSSNLNLEPFNFLIAEETKRTPWSELSFDQQKNLVMVLLSCPFIFVKPPFNTRDVTAEFVTLWNSKEYTDVTQQMTQFMIANKTNPSPVWLYNITGLIHHTAEQGGSHFANGGKVKELFTVFFPFVMETVQNTVPENLAPRSFNKFQMLQMFELTSDMLLCLLLGQTSDLAAINFAAPEMKQTYFKALEKAKEESVSALVTNSFLKPPVIASVATQAESLAPSL